MGWIGLFFFQAEDGIRDFCLARGLGDVYEREVVVVVVMVVVMMVVMVVVVVVVMMVVVVVVLVVVVVVASSYTHLTVPTNREV